MSELKLPRLLAAAKEFNIGQDTLIDFLVGKGFVRDDLKPTAKLSEAMYLSLQNEFQSDKVAKNKADLVEMPTGYAEKKRRDEEEAIVKKVKEEATPSPTPTVEVQTPTPSVDIPATIDIPEADNVIEVAVSPEPNVEIVKEVTENIRLETPEIEGLKIIAKIDISEIDHSTRPKKSAKKKEENKPVEEVKEMPTVIENPVVDQVIELPQTQPPESEAPVIENIKAEKLEGPKVLGKIQLPVENDTRPKAGMIDEKRKRKRIPIEKKPAPPADGKVERFHGPREQGGRTGGQQSASGDRNRGGNRHNDRRQNRNQQPADREINQKEIQDKIRETQAKLAGSTGRGKSLKAKYRRERRQETNEADERTDDNKLQVTEFVTVSELANLMDVSFAEIIGKCMSLGIMASINQRLDAEVIELVAGEFGFEVEFIGVDDVDEDTVEEDTDNPEDLEPRPPIVTIMGHVDHGKTSLLDYIRNANVVAGEAGGITQHIGAYEVRTKDGRSITFLDTPGHEAFTAMRARGAKVTDIAVIVVAADDAVMPQTREAISHAQAAGVPMVFAVNKIDKDGANPTKIYEQLSQMNILVEAWGGKYQNQEISAKSGLNVDLLMEKILLEADILDLKSNPDKNATGTIIEASLDKGRGYVATVLVQHGTLSQGDIMVSGQYFGRIKAMLNERNQRATDAPPSTPVQILGLNGAPQAGEKFRIYDDESEAKDIATRRAQLLREQGLRARKHITLDEIGRRLALGNFKELKLIIKGDVDGSVEALSDSLQKLSTEEIAIAVVHKAVGQISESDVLLATASDAIIVGFNVRASSQAGKLADTEGVEIKTYSIIYNAIEEIKSAMEGLLEPKVQEKEVASIEIRQVFKFDKAVVAGCYVTDGKVRRDSKLRLFRDGILIYPRQEGGFAELASLKRFKDDVKEVATGYECGLTLKNFADIQVGDTVVAYEEEEIKRTL
jgi:translation initiation factor IF-2